MALLHPKSELTPAEMAAMGRIGVRVHNSHPDPSPIVTKASDWIRQPDKPGEVWYDYDVRKVTEGKHTHYVFDPVFFFSDPDLAFEFKLHWC